MGVFASCIDRIYEMTKKERRKDNKSALALDRGLNRFWMNQSCFAFVKMLEKLVSNSSTARTEFFAFLTEDQNNENGEDTVA
jgi:hypothetical protein